MKNLLLLLFLFPVLTYAQSAPQPNPSSLEMNEKAVALVARRDFTGAEEMFQKALSEDNKNTTAAFNLAGMYLQNKKAPEAVALLKKYVELYPNDVGLHSRLGDAYFVSKQIELAILNYEKAISLNPKYPGPAARLGTLYSLKNNPTIAEKYLTQAVTLSPQDGELLSNLASVKLANGKAKEAIEFAQKSIRVTPSKEAYATLGSAYLEMKDEKNALSSFQQAKKLGDSSEQLLQMIADLEKK